MPNGVAAHADNLHHGHAHAHHPALQHHFQTLEQQHEASTLGMWIFLVTEVMFFGGLFAAYSLYRIWYPEAWSEGSLELDILLGGNPAGLASEALRINGLNPAEVDADTYAAALAEAERLRPAMCLHQRAVFGFSGATLGREVAEEPGSKEAGPGAVCERCEG